MTVRIVKGPSVAAIDLTFEGMTSRLSPGAAIAARSTRMWTTLLAALNVAMAGALSLVVLAILR